ncbi:MAG: pyruvate ferredoxin oxidoreductase [candidate division WS1 bacterium]|jgi:pyruvate ferredoxin oxidoreductase alpha subunit|nr:pyruvate ferredoxin oxidoreductase [candidate division WS1 bacterium]
MPEIKPMEGNQAVAEAMRQINPDVVAAYPITPSTEVVQTFSSFVANGLVDTNYVAVESEHSAMSACTAAAVAGGRVMNATSSQGLALMWEILYITASLRAPVILTVVNRALSGNINIHCDHSDGMGARDCGWVQLYGENVQEGYDNLLQAVRIGEALDVRLPVMNCIDGFLVSHSYELLQVEDDAPVKDFVGPYQAVNPLLDISHPISIGPLDLWDYYFEHKRGQCDAYPPAKEAILAVGKEFGKTFGREYGLMEEFMLEDAELAVVALGSTAGVAKVAVESLREDGVKAGLLKLRAFRPFPAAEIAAALQGKKAIAVFDRAISFGAASGPLFSEVAAALYTAGQQIPALSVLYGLGGREITPEQISGVFRQLPEVASGGQPADPVLFLGVRE